MKKYLSSFYFTVILLAVGCGQSKQRLEGCDCCVHVSIVGHGNLFKCTRAPMQPIDVLVCRQNIEDAKTLAEEAVEALTSPPSGNSMKVDCQ